MGASVGLIRMIVVTRQQGQLKRMKFSLIKVVFSHDKINSQSPFSQFPSQNPWPNKESSSLFPIRM